MLKIRKSFDRGHANRGWLDSYHSFSFADYHDPSYMHYSVLRVINEDVIEASMGFGMHAHHDMEIVTYILSGQLRHQDSIGNGSVIGVGDVQRMTAGTGVKHSEFNNNNDQSVHLLQIWIQPAELHLPPSYEEKHFSIQQKQDQWCLIVAHNGKKGAVTIHQDAYIYASLLARNKALSLMLKPNRCGYLHVAKGEVIIQSAILSAGDAVMIEDIEECKLMAKTDAELILFDLPKAL